MAKKTISSKDLKPFDVIRVRHQSIGECIGIVRRVWESGGKWGATVIGLSLEGASFEIHVNKVEELLWREDTEAK